MENVHSVTVTIDTLKYLCCHLPSCGTVRYRGLPRTENRSTEASDRDAAGVKEKIVYEVRSAFCVPHNETDLEVAIDMVYEQEMFGQHRCVAPNEVMLGW